MAEEEVDEVKFEYCQSCGIRIKGKEDHGGSDPENKWCKGCCNPDGSRKSREEIKKKIVELVSSDKAYIVMGERATPEELDKMAEEYMKKLPAWEG